MYDIEVETGILPGSISLTYFPKDDGWQKMSDFLEETYDKPEGYPPTVDAGKTDDDIHAVYMSIERRDLAAAPDEVKRKVEEIRSRRNPEDIQLVSQIRDVVMTFKFRATLRSFQDLWLKLNLTKSRQEFQIRSDDRELKRLMERRRRHLGRMTDIHREYKVKYTELRSVISKRLVALRAQSRFSRFFMNCIEMDLERMTAGVTATRINDGAEFSWTKKLELYVVPDNIPRYPTGIRTHMLIEGENIKFDDNFMDYLKTLEPIQALLESKTEEERFALGIYGFHYLVDDAKGTHFCMMKLCNQRYLQIKANSMELVRIRRVTRELKSLLKEAEYSMAEMLSYYKELTEHATRIKKKIIRPTPRTETPRTETPRRETPVRATPVRGPSSRETFWRDRGRCWRERLHLDNLREFERSSNQWHY